MFPSEGESERESRGGGGGGGGVDASLGGRGRGRSGGFAKLKQQASSFVPPTKVAHAAAADGGRRFGQVIYIIWTSCGDANQRAGEAEVLARAREEAKGDE